ncbi:MAG: ABC transporter permease [candidate division Zixibacteria bacterium]
MFKNYFKIAIRNLLRNRFYTFVNVFGLGVAMAICVVGYVNYQFSQGFDFNHANIENIHLVLGYDDNAKWAHTPFPLAQNIKEQIPEVENICRMSNYGGHLRYGNRVFGEGLHFVDKEFFDIFSFPLIKGTGTSFQSRDGIVLSERLAQKYFGDEDPVGKEIILSLDGDKELTLKVQGIISTPPLNSTLQLDAVTSIENYEYLREFDFQEWDKFARATILELKDPSLQGTVQDKLQKFVEMQNTSNPDFQVKGFQVMPYSDLASMNREISSNPFDQGMHPAAIMAPSVIAILVLLLACFNFINTAIAYANRRLREIGIRKVLGGLRWQLIRQFMGENLLLCFLALIVAALLSEIFVPAYDNLWPELSLRMNYSENLGLVGFFIGLLLFTAVAAGAYPALYISKFRPVEIIKGNLKLGGTNPLIRILLTMQLAIAMTTIIGAVVLSQNANYIAEMDLGYDMDNVIVVPVNGEQQYLLLKNSLATNPNITSIAATRHLMNRFFSGRDVIVDGEEKYVHLFEVGENYFSTLGFELTDGRIFNTGLGNNSGNEVIVNETLVKQFGFEEPLGKQISLKGSDTTEVCTIIGVVRDFYPNGLWSRLRPTVMRPVDPEQYAYMAIRCQDENPGDIAGTIESLWKESFPHLPYEGFWFEDTYAENNQVNESIKLVFQYIAMMVLIISCMGLYALVSLNISKRTKEIGIRKVLGATVTNIGALMSREFVVLTLIGSVLASAMGYYMVDMLMSSIWMYYTDFGLIPFILAPLLVIVLALLTVSYRIYSAASANPVDALRYE